MGMISPEFKWAGTLRRRKGMWLCRGNAGIFNHGCIFILRWKGWWAHWYCCIAISHTIPTHCSPPCPSYRTCFVDLSTPPPPFYVSCDAKGSWPALISLRVTHRAYQQLVQIGHAFQFGLVNVERFCWSLLGSTLSKIRVAGSLFLCLCLSLSFSDSSRI